MTIAGEAMRYNDEHRRHISMRSTYIYDDGGSMCKMFDASDDFDHPEQGATDKDFSWHLDALGSVRSLTDSDGGTAVSYTYTPYGEMTTTDGTDNDAKANHNTFTARDYETSFMMFYRSRFYANRMGRFATKDMYPPNYSSIMSINRYLYVKCNPTNQIDPFGLCGISSFNRATYKGDCPEIASIDDCVLCAISQGQSCATVGDPIACDYRCACTMPSGALQMMPHGHFLFHCPQNYGCTNDKLLDAKQQALVLLLNSGCLHNSAAYNWIIDYTNNLSLYTADVPETGYGWNRSSGNLGCGKYMSSYQGKRACGSYGSYVISLFDGAFTDPTPCGAASAACVLIHETLHAYARKNPIKTNPDWHTPPSPEETWVRLQMLYHCSICEASR